jgi:hypothetical protein
LLNLLSLLSERKMILSIVRSAQNDNAGTLPKKDKPDPGWCDATTGCGL